MITFFVFSWCFSNLISRVLKPRISKYASSARTGTPEATANGSVNTTVRIGASGNLEYFVVDGHGSATKNYSIDNVKIYKDKTSPSGTPDVDIPFTQGDAQLVSSLSNKVNLKAYYSMNSTLAESLKGSTDYATDFSTTVSSSNDASDNSDWSQTGSTVAISSGALRATTVNTASDDRITKALGFTLSNSKWTCQFEVTPSSSNHTNIIALTDGSGN